MKKEMKINFAGLKNIFLLVGFTLLCSMHASAQLIDSIQLSIKKKPKFDFWMESRNSFISSRKAEMRGIKIAAAFNKNFYIGGGINCLECLKLNPPSSSSFSKPVYLYDSLGRIDTVTARLKMVYLSYFLEYVFYKTHKWEFSIPVQMGFGGSYYKYNFEGKDYNRLQRHPVILYEPALSGEYMIFKWFGVGANIGFRLMMVKNRKIPEKFTSVLYTFKTNIYWGELYRAIMRL